jgi:hypothetical protein
MTFTPSCHIDLALTFAKSLMELGGETLAHVGSAPDGFTKLQTKSLDLICKQDLLSQMPLSIVGPRAQSDIPLEFPDWAIMEAEKASETDQRFAEVWRKFYYKEFSPSCRVEFDSRLLCNKLYFQNAEVLGLDRRNVGSGVGNLVLNNGSTRALSTYSCVKLRVGEKIEGPLEVPVWSEQTLAIARKVISVNIEFSEFWKQFVERVGRDPLLTPPTVLRYSEDQLSKLITNHFSGEEIVSPSYIGFVIYSSGFKILSSASGQSREGLGTKTISNIKRRLKALGHPIDIFSNWSTVGSNLTLGSPEGLSIQFFVNTSR